MKAGIVSRVLMVGLILATAAVAQAGGAGGGGGGIVVPLVCYEINGDDVSATASVTSELRGPETLRLGNARLVCTPTTALTVNGRELEFNDLTASHLKCYSVSGPRLGPQPDTTLIDPLGIETVPLARSSHLCLPASIDD